MRRLIYATLVLMVGVVSYSCTPVKYAIQGSYQPATSVVTSKSFDNVWNNVIDFFAENNLPIEILEKDSGLIVSNNIKVGDNLVTWEDENGKSHVITYDPAIDDYQPYAPLFEEFGERNYKGTIVYSPSSDYLLWWDAVPIGE